MQISRVLVVLTGLVALGCAAVVPWDLQAEETEIAPVHSRQKRTIGTKLAILKGVLLGKKAALLGAGAGVIGGGLAGAAVYKLKNKGFGGGFGGYPGGYASGYPGGYGGGYSGGLSGQYQPPIYSGGYYQGAPYEGGVSGQFQPPIYSGGYYQGPSYSGGYAGNSLNGGYYTNPTNSQKHYEIYGGISTGYGTPYNERPPC